MPIPVFNQFGDLVEGRHEATLAEIEERFGCDTARRSVLSKRLREVYELALATGALDRLIVFGSFVSNVPEPNDIDVMLVMNDGFRLENCPPASLVLFDHQHADRDLGASIFWIRPGMLMGEPIDAFLAHWEKKRDGRRRGIVEIRT